MTAQSGISSMPIVDRMIAEPHRGSISELGARFQNAKPFRHLVLDDFLEPTFARRLRESFPPFDETLAINENGQVGGKCVHEDLQSLGGGWRELDNLVSSREFLQWLGHVTGIDDLKYDPYYFGAGTHENRHGQDLDPHVDFNRHPVTGWHRRLNLIIYLNEEWQAEWGGAIEFHSDPRKPAEENQIKIVQPEFNRAVLFETTYWSWHGFERIDLPQGDEDPRSRKSAAFYFYSNTRPEEEITPKHSTIYVDRPLPKHIRAGAWLSDEDYRTVERLLARRDQHIQRLYRDISDLTERLESAGSASISSLGARVRRKLGILAKKLGIRRPSP